MNRPILAIFHGTIFSGSPRLRDIFTVVLESKKVENRCIRVIQFCQNIMIEFYHSWSNNLVIKKVFYMQEHLTVSAWSLAQQAMSDSCTTWFGSAFGNVTRNLVKIWRSGLMFPMLSNVADVLQSFVFW